MERAASIEDLLVQPVGRFSAGPTHLVWRHSPSLCGTVHWGRPGMEEAGQLIRRLDASTRLAPASGLDVVTDARALEHFDWSAFRLISDYMKSRLPRWSRHIRRQAIFVPPGVPGVFVAGLMPLLGACHPVRLFREAAEAAEWMGLRELPAVFGEVERLVDGLREVPPLLRTFREHLDCSLAGATIDGAARALGVSSRSLQRQLRKHGTSFSAELAQARLRAASLLLQHSGEKIESIANSVGCASSRLSVIFRRQYGVTPADYRARSRTG